LSFLRSSTSAHSTWSPISCNTQTR
jgi:hypothetical protein